MSLHTRVFELEFPAPLLNSKIMTRARAQPLPRKIRTKMAATHGFSQQALEKKLQNLTSTMQNIQAVAQWAIHYRKHAKTIVGVWYKEVQKGKACSYLPSLVAIAS